jgi:hypothetical protein
VGELEAAVADLRRRLEAARQAGHTADERGQSAEDPSRAAAPAPGPAEEECEALRTEVTRLRSQVAALEEALRGMGIHV